MVDSNQSNKRGIEAQEENDPLAELSNIMNFGRPGDHAHDISSVELENELLGELASVAGETARAEPEFTTTGASAPIEEQSEEIDLDKELQKLLQGLDFEEETSEEEPQSPQAPFAAEPVAPPVSAPAAPFVSEPEPTPAQGRSFPQPAFSTGERAGSAEPKLEAGRRDNPAPDWRQPDAPARAFDPAPSTRWGESSSWRAPETTEQPEPENVSATAGAFSGRDATAGDAGFDSTAGNAVPVQPETRAEFEPALTREVPTEPVFTAPQTGEVAAQPPAEIEEPAPIIETLDLPDAPQPVDDDLDIPEVTVEPAPPARPDFYELDADFESAFSKLGEFEKTLRQDAPPPAPEHVSEPAPAAPSIAPAAVAAAGAVGGVVTSGTSTGATTTLRPVEPMPSRNHFSEGEFEPAAARTVSYHPARAAQAEPRSVAPGREPYAEPEPYHGGHAEPAEPEMGEAGAANVPAEDGFDRWEPDQGNYEFDDLTLEEDELLGAPVAEQEQGRRRPWLVAAGIVAAVAVVGGIGAYALSGGGDDTDEPALVRADQDPVKVKPADPGGAVAPNEDKAVYERVAGGEDRLPSQETLIETEEEPVDIATEAQPRVVLPATGESSAGAAPADEEDEIAALAKNEDRLAPEASEQDAEAPEEFIAVEPRRVRTLVVRPDGTLVPREEAVAAAPSASAEAAARTMTTPPASSEEVAEENDATAGTLQQDDAAEAPQEAAAPAERRTEAPAPAAAERPAPAAPQPAQREVAAATPPATSATSEWWVQISSQPSRELAQTSYADLAGRHGNIIGGRPVNIYPAQIEGKGTFYRVRIAASSRAEANQLCERLKSAGAGCFVTR